MSLSAFDGLLWLLAGLLPLLFVQRRLHFEIQAVFLLLTRSPSIALALFSFLFFPGVVLHEASHYLMARLLWVRTGRISLLPQVLPDGTLRMGYVETARADPLRDSLVGTAPLIAGGAVMLYLGLTRLGLLPVARTLTSADWPAFWAGIAALPSLPDFWLWFYLAFVISSTMLPSSSDRQGWLPLVLVLAVLLGLAVFAGAGPWLLENLAPRLNAAFRVLASIFGISLAVHIVFLFPVYAARKLLNRLTGLHVFE